MRDELPPLLTARSDVPIVTNHTVVASNLFIGVTIVALLYFGRGLFVPVVIAGLLSFVLAPLVLFFRRWRAGRVGGVLAAVTLVLLILAGLGGVMIQQMAQLVDNLPGYEQTVSEKIRSLRGVANKPALFDRLSDMVSELGQTLSSPQSTGKSTAISRLSRRGPAGTPAEPVTVEIEKPGSRPFEAVETFAGPLLGVLASTGIVAVFVFFMLLFREDLRDRFVRLAGAQDLGRTSAAMDDAGRRLSRYFLIQSSVNASFGVLIGAGLWLIGIPNPVLLGALAGLMRFIPYIGAVIAAIVPGLLAVAVAPGWSMLLWTLGLFAISELILGQVIEPLLYGHHTGLSPIAVIVAAAFWTWLWGPMGLLLSTPVTVCVLVLGRHVERFEFLHILLGDQPALTPPQSFIQRMLAGDPHEAADQAERFMREHSLCEYYDDVAIPGLMIARHEIQRGGLSQERLGRVKETVQEFVDDLYMHDDDVVVAQDMANDSSSSLLAAARPGEAPDASRVALSVVTPESLKPEWRGERPMLCIGARDSLDEAAAVMLAQLFDKHGLKTRVESPAAASASNVFALDSPNLAGVCVVCLGSASSAHQRYLVRRLRRKVPRALLLVVNVGESTKPADRTDASSDGTRVADYHPGSFREAVELCIGAAQEHPKAPSEDAALPEDVPLAPAIGPGQR